MYQNHNLKQKLIACVLLLSLFLQSCTNFSNSVIPTGSVEIQKKHLSNQPVIKTKSIAIKQLIGKELTAEGGHLVTFDEQEGNLQAGVKINAPEGFGKTYTNLPVSIAKDIDITQLLHLNKEEQKRVVHFNSSKNDQLCSIIVYRPGLLGGGNSNVRGTRTEEVQETIQDILRLSDIKELRKYFYKGYLEIIPKNYEQLIELTQRYESLFKNYEGGVFVKGWESARDLSSLIDLLVLFDKIKKFKINCASKDQTELGGVLGRAIPYYKELEELNLAGCQLSDAMMEDILEAIAFPEKLRKLDVSNNKLSVEMITSLQRRFSNAQVSYNTARLDLGLRGSNPASEGASLQELEGSSDSSSQPSTSQLSRRSIPSSVLPSIHFNYQACLEVMDEIPMTPQKKEKAILYLKNIQQKMDDIKRYQSKKHIGNFYDPMQVAICDIHNTAEALYELTQEQECDTPILSNKLRGLILQSINLFEVKLNKRLEMSVTEEEALRVKTKRLYAEQSYIARQEDLQKKLMEHLHKLKKLLTEADTPPFRCCISYAWPSKKNQKEEYWVQPFLCILYNHLAAAGIRVIMDILDNQPGNSIYEFMKQYHTVNYIILVGTESLLQKHYNPRLHAVQTELSIISNRFEQDKKQHGHSCVCPLLISGTSKTSFPEIYDKYRTVRDAIDKGYVPTLQFLLSWMYKRRINKDGTKYTDLWYDFNKNCPGLSKDADSQKIEEELNIGHYRNSLDQLKQGLKFQAVQAQKKAKFSSAENAEPVAASMKAQGKNPKFFYSEYGQQFQRPSITPGFIERERLWKRIVDYFDQPDQPILTLSVHGLGGIGKTELAKYYYLHPYRSYTLRAWFNAEDKELLYSQYVDLAKFAKANKLAKAKDIELKEEMHIQEQAGQVKNWLERQKDCLLVYNNVQDANQLEGLLPKRKKHHILITSRNEVDWFAHQKLDIDVMEEDEAIALIGKITGCQKENVRIKELVNTLNYLPLALAQAGAYIQGKKTSIEDYLDLYRKDPSSVMNDTDLPLNPKHELVWVTFDRDFEALRKECPSALVTLKQASWLGTSVIPELLLKTMLQDTSGKSVDFLWGVVKRHIGRYSLMRIDTEEHQLSMHRLLQGILRDQQDGSERKKILNQIALSIKSIYPKNDKTREAIALVRLLLPHMETTSTHLKEFFNENEYANFNLEFNLTDAYRTIGQRATESD
jgi:hypothetical protein